MKINNFFNSKVDLQLEGLNFERLLNYLKQNNVTINNLKRDDYKVLAFNLSVTDYKKALKIKAFKNYKIVSKTESGIYYFFKYVKKQVGLLAGALTAIILFTFFSTFTFHINIDGNVLIKTQEIVDYLKTQNIYIGKQNDFNNDEVEMLLKQKFSDISLVSVIRQGTNIVISIKEKEKINTQSADVVAPANLIITHIEVNQGTQLVQVGDIVVANTALVGGYVVGTNNEKTYCNPIATIEAEAWYFGRVEFETKEIIYKETGKKVVSGFVSIFNRKFWETSGVNNFKYYKTTEQKLNPFINWFLPIKINKTIVAELKPQTITRNFEREKAKLVAQSKTLAYKEFPSNLEAEEEVLVISQIGTKYIVQTAIKTTINLSFN